MSIIALQVVNRRRHPHADALHVYDFTAPGLPSLQIVGGSENTYQPGDVVAVALAGTVLQDGTEIQPIRLRGIVSLGMALEPASQPAGTDLSEHYQVQDAGLGGASSGPRVVKWASVELLHHVRKSVLSASERVGADFVHPQITYRAKIKLDGTNGGVQLLPSGEVLAQSRSRLLSPSDDNMGFGAWVEANRSYFESVQTDGEHLIIFGEWCGQGIQKRTSISKVPRRIFAVFAIQRLHERLATSWLEVEPVRIRALLPEHPDVFVLPWAGQPVTMDYGDRASLERSASTINKLVDEVEACDPWVAETFGVEGLGEGVVLYPEPPADEPVVRETYTGLMFKAKGDKHQVVKQKKPAQIDPEVAANVGHFVELFVTPQRLEQGVTEACAGAYEMPRMGLFLKWIGQDVKKESSVELEASGLVWKDVGKQVTSAARRWYMDKVRAL